MRLVAEARKEDLTSPGVSEVVVIAEHDGTLLFARSLRPAT